MASAPSVIVIDAERLTATLAGDILRVLGFSPVIMSYSAEEGEGRLEREKPDIVMLDLECGGGRDGLDLVRRLRDAGASYNPLVPVIVMTAHSDIERVFAARDAGANEFLAKPFTPRAIFQRLAEVVERPRPFVVLPSFFGPDRRRSSRPFDGEDKRMTPAMPAPGVRVGGAGDAFLRELRKRASEGNLA
ncbi:MAG: response regulator [Alphaproteobacteria bacterium]|nr:response regulator [Alphaproteobacteria bacterium]